jgi:hypothetical protein
MSLNTEVGGATANSYVSLASANEYFDSRENSDVWVDMVGVGSYTATARKEGLLKQATRELDVLRYSYTKYQTVPFNDENYQALEFPRSINTDSDGNLYIPPEVKDAQYEQAIWILERGGLKSNPLTGFEFASPIIGKQTHSYIDGWVDRQVKKTGSFKDTWRR